MRTRHHLLNARILVPTAAALGACAGIYACSSSNSSTSGGGSFACVGNVATTKPTEAQATFSAVLVELNSDKTLANANVTMCGVIDMTCAGPIGTPAKSGADGTISFSVPTGTAGFDGYGKIELAGYVPLLDFAGPPPSTARAQPFRVTMVPTSMFDAFITSAGATKNAERGHVAVRALDCGNNPTAGVTLKLSNADGKITTVYVNDLGAPIKDAPSTDATGRVVFLNVPIGATTVVATLTSTGQTIGKRQLVVQKGFVTATELPPT